MIVKGGKQLQTPTTNNFLTTIFKFELWSYLHITIVGMKRATLWWHKESIILCEEGSLRLETKNYLSIPQGSKTTITPINQITIGKLTTHVLYKLSPHQPQCGHMF
jgi:hypothetical protein